MSERRQLINLAYRLLGSLADAEVSYKRRTPAGTACPRTSRIRSTRPARGHEGRRARDLPRRAGPPESGGTLCGRVDTGAPPGRTRWISARSGAATVTRPTGSRWTSRQHGVPRRTRVDDACRASRVHPPLRVPPLIQRSGRDRRPHAGCVSPLASSARHRIDTSHPIAEPTAEHARLVRTSRRMGSKRTSPPSIELLDPQATATGDGGGVVTAVLAPDPRRRGLARFYVERADALGRPLIVERTVNGHRV